MKMPKRKCVSFCIPSFNRRDKIYALVKQILKCCSVDIEVVVLDNCSDDNTIELLSQINDDRLVLINNESNIGGILNILKVLTFAHGEYALLCLDKDFVDYKYIDILVSKLQEETEVSFGYCTLNLKESSASSFYQKGFQSVLNMSYLSSHPTGRFYKTDIYKELPILKQIFSDPIKFGFYLDMVNAEMSFWGKSMIINLPLFNTETELECAERKTFTYKNDDIYFFPKGRLLECTLYMKSADSLPLNNSEKRRVIRKIFLDELIASTLSYRAFMSNAFICAHHCIDPCVVSIRELLGIGFCFCISFMQLRLNMSMFQKLFICVEVLLNSFLRMLYHLVPKK